MTQHLLGLAGCAILGPWRLIVEAEKLRGVDVLSVGVSDGAFGALERGPHLVLNYSPFIRYT